MASRGRRARRNGRGREAGEKAVNARTLWDAGVTYGFGTDTGYLPKEGLAHELRALNLMFSTQDLVKLMGPNTAAFIDKSDAARSRQELIPRDSTATR